MAGKSHDAHHCKAYADWLVITAVYKSIMAAAVTVLSNDWLSSVMAQGRQHAAVAHHSKVGMLTQRYDGCCLPNSLAD